MPRFLFVAAAPWLPAMAIAQSGELLAAHTLDRVTVTGGRPSTLPVEIPTTLESITGQAIQETINATDSEDALKYFPSLLVRKRYAGDYNHAVLSTRASGTGNSARSMVFADGILLSNLLGNGATFAPRWGLVTPEEIDRVDVLYGPFSAAYAGNSAGAVVDYVTRMPTGFEAHAKLGGFTQPFDLYNTHTTYNGWQSSVALGDRQGAFAWWVDLSRLDSEGQPLTFATRTVASGTVGNAGTPVTGAVLGKSRSNDDWYLLGTGTQYRTVQDHLKAKFAFDITPTLRASYTFGAWRNNAQASAESYLRDGAGNPVRSGTVNVNGRSYALPGQVAPSSAQTIDLAPTQDALQHTMHALSVKSFTRGTFDWEVAASRYHYDRDTSRTPTVALPAASTGGAGRIVDQAGTGWSTLAVKGIWRPDGVNGAHVAEAGLQQDSFHWRSRSFAADDWAGGDPTSPYAAFRGDTRLRSAYAQDAWRFAHAWKTVIGLRAEDWAAFNGNTASGNLSFGHASRSERHLSPKAALSYEVSEAWTLKASTGRAVRMPTVGELYQGGFSGNVFTNGNPDLKPEKSWTQELTSEWDVERQHFRATFFHEDTRDALYSQTNVTVTPNVTNVQNVDRVRTSGLELAYQGRDVLRRGVDLGGSVTYADSRIVANTNFPASVGKLQPRVPKWRASLVATWRPDDRWTATYGARYSGVQYSTLDNSDPNGFAYQGSSKFFTTDVRVTYRFTKQWSAALGVDNLNNYRYWNFHPYPQRTYSAELKFDL